MQLREYQLQTIGEVEATLQQHQRIILQAPCGAGKTVMAVEIIKRYLEDTKRILFVAHREELIDQCSDKLTVFGIDHGIIQAKKPRNLFPDVQVTMIQTFTRRLKADRLIPPPAELIIFDECHHAAANSYISVLKEYPDAQVIGLTATPLRGDGVGLGGDNLFQDMVFCPSIKELIEMGHLVPVRHYAPSKPDLEGLKIKMGDYSETQLQNRMDKVQLIGDIVQTWAKFGENRQTVVFSTGVRHSKHIRDMFLDAGVIAEHIDGKTPKDERKEILVRLASGETRIITNCMVLTEGWDCPPVSCIILARPTKSLGLFLQMAGRGLRPYPGKSNTILIDHSGAIDQHGFVHTNRDWALDPYETIEARSSESKPTKPITCQECSFVYEAEPKCPVCGFMPTVAAKSFEVADGDLGYLDESGEWTPERDTPYQRERFYQELYYHGMERGFKKGYASANFKEKYGSWPPKYKPNPVKPGAEVRRYINIKRNEYWNKQQEEKRQTVAL